MTKIVLGFDCQQACEFITSSLHLLIHVCIYLSTVKRIQYLDSGIELQLPSQLENSHYGPVQHMFSSVTTQNQSPLLITDSSPKERRQNPGTVFFNFCLFLLTLRVPKTGEYEANSRYYSLMT